jgi:hypothetical protein
MVVCFTSLRTYLMAISQCFRCGGRSFELVMKAPLGYPGKIMFIQCSVCGGVVGVQEEHVHHGKNNHERIVHKQDSVQSSIQARNGHPMDINTVLKRLYG